MFTGLVEETGRIVSFEPKAEAWALVIGARTVLGDLALGDSIAVNGCCLTVTHFDATSLRCDVLEETRRLTNFSALRAGGVVNLERSLRFGGKVGGHFVTGHIDTLGNINRLEARGKDHYLEIGIAADLTRHVVHKGSIALDGVSLTIADTSDDSFAVWLIPHTLAVTNFRHKQVGDPLNVEFDLLGKHVEKLLLNRTA